MSTLQTRLFKLGRNLNNRDEFNKVGENNLVTSIREEEGTLAMYSTHLPDDEAMCYVFEVYASEDAYNVHAASPQFKAYVNMAATTLTSREVFSLVPELMCEKREGLMVLDGTAAPRCCFVTILPDKLEKFREAVFANMRTSVEAEPGVLVLYAASMADDPLSWVFWEVYASEEAYEAHRNTEHFKTYIANTADCLSEKELVPLVADTLVSKGVLGA